VIVTIPTLTLLSSPSMVTDELPTVRIPTILALPKIFKSFLPVIIPIESTLVTSSYVIVPAADTLPVVKISP